MTIEQQHHRPGLAIKETFTVENCEIFEARVKENYYGGLDVYLEAGNVPEIGAKVKTEGGVEYTVEKFESGIIYMVHKINRSHR
jgi:hypothetical protein